MVMNGHAWSCIVICGYVWPFIVFCGYVWPCMVHIVMYDHGHVLSYTLYGKAWSLWSCMVMYSPV